MIKSTGMIMGCLIAVLPIHSFSSYDRAPRADEPAGVENPLLSPEAGQAVCCPLPRDGNFTGDLYVGGDLIVDGAIFGVPGTCNNTLFVKEGILHGPNEFNSIKAAVDSITTNSISNPYVIKICPGTYIEDTIALKPYVALTTAVPGEATIQASNPANDIIIMSPFSVVQGLQLQGATDPGSAAIAFNGGGAGGCLIQNCVFGSNDILINQTATAGPACIMFIESCLIWSSSNFRIGFQVNSPGVVPAILKASTLSWLQSNNSILDTLFDVSGPLAVLILNSSDCGDLTLIPSGVGIQVQNGGRINIKAVTLAGFTTAFNAPNVGAAPAIRILASTSNNCTNDIVIDHPSAAAVIEGVFNDQKITIDPSAAVSMFILDPVHIETVTVGNQKVGNTISQVTNITPSIQQGATLGTITGGTLSDAGGLNVQALAGTGYLMVGTAPNDYLQYITWSTQSIALPANQDSFIWVDNTGTVQSSLTASDPITTIPLGKAETSGTNILFLQEQPQQATHLATNLNVTLQNGFGPIFNDGSIVTANGLDQLNVSPGNYFFGSLNYMPAGGLAISWDAFYQNGSGGENAIVGQNLVDYQNYDDGSGVLAPIPANQFARHAFYVVNDGVYEQYLLVYGQAVYTTLSGAEAGGIPPEPSSWSGNIALIASIIVENNAAVRIAEIIDERPRLGFQASGTTAITPTYQEDSGIASPVSGILKVFGGQNITTSGAGDTVTINVSGTTQYAVQVGNATNSLTSLAVGTNGQVLLGSTGANPVFAALGSSASTLTYTSGAGSLNIDITAPVTVLYGGTGATSFTANQLIASGTTATGAFQQIGYGTANQVLTSNGVGVLPTFQSLDGLGAITTINGDSGSPVTPTAGAVTIAGGSNIDTSGAGSTLTVDLVSSPSVTGSLTAGTTITAGTGITSTTGNIIATAGQVNAGTTMTAGTGITATTGNITATAGQVNSGTTMTAGTGITSTTGDVTITAGNLNIANSTSSSVGNVTKGGTNFIQNFGTNNTFVGVGAGNFTLTSTDDTGVGYNALASLTTSVGATAVGSQALAASTTGVQNTAVGYKASFSSTTGGANTAIGYQALLDNIGGLSNTAVGALSLQSNKGSNNSAFGVQALNANVTGFSNSAFGYQALLSNTAPLNTAFGSQAMRNNVSGSRNTAVGFGALFNNTMSDNTAMGYQAMLSNTTGETNVAFGNLALQNNLTGSFNAAFGGQALQSNTSGILNIGFGAAAMFSNLTGSQNIGIGTNALQLNTAGNDNVGIGNAALFSNTASNSVGIGTSALRSATSGGSNVAIGYLAGNNITTGTNNTYIGASAGSSNTTSDSANIYIGRNQVGAAGENNTTRIGVPATTTRCFIGGIRGITTGAADAIAVLVDSAGQLGTVSSSIRYKENIADLEDSVQRFMQLRPVVFTYKSDESKTQQLGLIAEEVANLYPELVVYDEQGQAETIKYHLLYALLIKMIQENRKITEENRALIQELFALHNKDYKGASCA